MHLSTPSTRPKRNEKHDGFPLHWAAQSDAVALLVSLCKHMERVWGSLIPDGCWRGVWATVPEGAAPQSCRVMIGPAEAMESMLKAERALMENEQCILKLNAVERLSM